MQSTAAPLPLLPPPTTTPPSVTSPRAQVEKAGMLVPPRLAAEAPPELDALEARLGRLENELLELNGNSERLNRSYNERLELQLVL